MPGISGVGDWIVYVYDCTVRFELAHDVDHPTVADVRAVLLEGKPQHYDVLTADGEACLNQLLDRLFGDEFAHAVVDAPAGQDHLGVVAELLRLMCQIVGVDADTMTADQTGTKRQEIPLGS